MGNAPEKMNEKPGAKPGGAAESSAATGGESRFIRALERIAIALENRPLARGGGHSKN